jgi:Terminase large subunit, T4likevirus-type, N-terminal
MADISIATDLALALDPTIFARRVGIEPDLKQQELLTGTSRRTLVLCCRQWGKSTTAAILAAHEAIYNAGSLAVIVSPSQQQSTELFRKIAGFWKALPNAPKADQETLTRLSLENGSRIISLPGSEKTTRGYSAASLVVMDEASRVDDALLAAVRPMMATVASARFIALTTPAGKRGWFYEAWINGEGWHRISVRADECPRISKEFLAEELQSLGPMRFDAEYNCTFIDDATSAFNTALIEAAMVDDFEPFFARAA